MQQRRYRPGDVLDDYCPRERRITDHAIVAMIDEDIKQTRCVVCDAEHEYKDGKVPPQRRKKPAPALFTQVLDGLQPPQPAARLASSDGEIDELDDSDEIDAAGESPRIVPPAAATLQPLDSMPVPVAMALPMAAEPSARPEPALDEGPVRRQLIRAALPRPEGQPPPQQTRPIPEFTVRQPKLRGHRPGRRRGDGQPGFGGPHAAANRFGRSNGRSRRRGKKR